MSEQKTKFYTLDFKKSSAQLAATSEKSVAQIARELGVNVNTLHGWVKKYYSSTNSISAASNQSDIHEELKKLRKEVARLRQERDILKKATAYFARETQ